MFPPYSSVAGPVIDKVLKDMGCPEDVLIRCTVGTREVYEARVV